MSGENSAPQAFRIVLDVNVLVSKLNADLAGKSDTISQKAVAIVISEQPDGRRIQIVVSYPMIDTYRNVLLRKGFDQVLVEPGCRCVDRHDEIRTRRT